MNGPRKARFERLYKDGKRTSGRLLRVHALPGEGLVGIATSKRVGSHARRNHLKRRLKEGFRATGLGADMNLDLVLVAGPDAEAASFAAIVDEMRQLVMEMRSRWASGSACF